LKSQITTLLLPPIILSTLRKMRKLILINRGALFDGDDDLFKKYVRNAKNYAEYGCGDSTIWASKNSTARIFSVDTSAEWIEIVKRQTDPSRTKLNWIDCGPVGEWGRPKTLTHRKKFRSYAEAPWISDAKPDVILIDGKFRILCFLISYINAADGTIIIFDDYNNREMYHVIEEILRPELKCGRQAVFIVPIRKEIEINRAQELVNEFQFVLS
jgi:hypothetical protein